MTRISYSDPESEAEYQRIADSSSKPSAMGDNTIPDMDLTSHRNAEQTKARPRRRGRPAIGNGNED